VLYGTTLDGGDLNEGTVFQINTDGSGYKVMKSFEYSDGSNPEAELTLSGDQLYGTTYHGGNSDSGTIFQLNINGSGYTVLKEFTGSDGAGPSAGLTLSGRVLYGTTSAGGDVGCGTVFRLELPVQLAIQSLGNAVVLSWADPAFALQAAPSPTGTFITIPGATSPYTNFISGPQQFFRLIGNRSGLSTKQESRQT
jgi:uncharacterized repeat protein (TIGR03803 family)